MAYIFPRFSFAPARCGASSRHELAPLFSLFEDASREIQQHQRAARQQARKIFNPRFDVAEQADSYVLEGEVPGFKEENLSIEWKDNVLAISGHLQSATETEHQPKATTTAAETNTAVSDTSSVKSHQATVEDDEESGFEKVDSPATETPASTQPVTQTPVEASSAPAEKKPEVQHWIRERRVGEFSRQFSFPSQSVDHENIKASLQSGVLRIVVPKAPVPASRRINIE